MHLEHVAIHASDLDRSERFYVEGFGFERTRAYDNERFRTAFLRGDDGALIQLREPLTTELDSPSSGVDHLGIVVDDLAAAFDHVVEVTGCPVVEQPRSARQGVALAFVEDPDGTLVELIERGTE